MVQSILAAISADAVRASFKDDPRGQLTLEAAAEVTAIAVALQRRFRASECDADDLVFRGLAIRLEALASAILTCVGDKAADIEAVRRTLEGPEQTRSRAAGAP